MNILRRLANGVSSSQVRDLGTPAMALFEPTMKTKKATFGMSWFWFPEAQFGSAPGIIRTRVGYAGGTKDKPSYYSLGDHTETVDLDYDPEVTDYDKLLKMFWNNHNPTINCSRQYMSAIFYHDDEQKAKAEETMKEAQQKAKGKITTQILPADKFWEAEDYHQKYLLQQHPWVVTALDIDPGEDLIKSHVAARLNGYIGGYGKSSMFDVEWEKLGINEKMAHYVRNQMIRNHRGWATDDFSPFIINLIVFEFKRQDQPYNMTTSSWKLFFIENPICLMQPKLLIWIWIHEKTQKKAENIRWKNWT